MEDYFGTKELYDVQLKITYSLEVEEKSFQNGETILSFDKVLMSNINEVKKRNVARGGANNLPLIFWEESTQVQFDFSEGIFSKMGLAILSNAKMVTSVENIPYEIDYSEKLIVEDSKVELKYIPSNIEKIFIYKENGEKVIEFTTDGTKFITITEEIDDGDNILVRYVFNYLGKKEVLIIGQRFFPGFLSLVGKMRLKNDSTGLTSTSIIEIPKLKLMSDLSIRLGNSLYPMVNNFSGIGYPAGDRGHRYVCKIILLDEDISTDL